MQEENDEREKNQFEIRTSLRALVAKFRPQ